MLAVGWNTRTDVNWMSRYKAQQQRHTTKYPFMAMENIHGCLYYV